MPLRYKVDVLNALKEKGYNTSKIRTEGLLSQSTLQKFRQQQGVSWENLETLCALLDCQPGDLMEYARLRNIALQAWSPMQYGFFEGCFVDNEKFPELNFVLQKIGDKYGVSKTTIAIAWILRHPAKMQPITGTTNPARLVESFKATEFTLTREEWYEIYRSAGNILP